MDDFEGFDPEIESAFGGGLRFGRVKFNTDTGAFGGIKPVDDIPESAKTSYASCPYCGAEPETCFHYRIGEPRWVSSNLAPSPAKHFIQGPSETEES